MTPGSGESLEHVAYLCAGSNIGDRRCHIQKGLERLMDGGSRLKAQSAYYMTEPVDYTDQEWFLNAAFAINTSLDPHSLLKKLKSIEKASGRDFNAARFGPRPLDLDIIFYDDLVLSSPDLTIPHPRMHERRFVLKPLCDINADIAHPVLKRRVQDLLNDLPEAGQRIVPV